MFETKGDLEAAVEAYEQALATEPEDVPSLVRLGAIRLGQKRPADAARFLERATVARPDFRPAWIGLGRAYRELGRLEDALVAAWEVRDLGEDRHPEDRERIRELYRLALEASIQPSGSKPGTKPGTAP